MAVSDYRHCLYMSRAGDDDTQAATAMFRNTFAAHKFFLALVADDEWWWDDDAATSARGRAEPGTTVATSTGVVVSTLHDPDEMVEIVTHELTAEESARRLSPELARRALWFRAGPRLPRTMADVAEQPARRVTSAPRASRVGLVPASDVALQLGISPRDLRAALRRLRVPKPAAGWAWPLDEAERIKRLVQL